MKEAAATKAFPLQESRDYGILRVLPELSEDKKPKSTITIDLGNYACSLPVRNCPDVSDCRDCIHYELKNG